MKVIKMFDPNHLKDLLQDSHVYVLRDMTGPTAFNGGNAFAAKSRRLNLEDDVHSVAKYIINEKCSFFAFYEYDSRNRIIRYASFNLYDDDGKNIFDNFNKV